MPGVPISGRTKVVGLLGWPVAHSLSPAMHNAAFESLGLDFLFVPFPVAPNHLEDAVRGMRALGIKGCSVTTPHKERVIPWVALTSRASLVRAVNTLWVDDAGQVWGDNTDGAGLVAYATHVGVQVKGAVALVLGAGGSARSIVAALVQAGCARVTVLNRTVERAEGLIQNVGTGTRSVLEAGPFPSGVETFARDATLIVQCTSVGMGDDSSLAWDGRVPFRPEQAVFDLVYHPRRTAFLAKAEAEGARVLDGLGMLVFQGAIAFERWTGQQAPVNVMMRAVGA